MTTSTIDPAETSETSERAISPALTKIDTRILVNAFALLALFVGLFTFVQFGTPALAGNDGYYHIKMGLLIREQGLKPQFPWLPMSILNSDDFYDHHLLYHIYLALFASVDPAVDGGLALTQSAKLASILMPSLAFVAVWWLLRGQQVRWASLWTLGLFAVSEAFLYRMSMPRAQSASLLFLVLGLHLMLRRRFWALIPLGFGYVWLYNAFPLLLVLSAIYIVATLMTERRFAWQAFLYPAVGIGLGLLINPYFPQNISFILSHLLPKIGESATRVGNEWYPYETWTLIENSGFGLAVFVLGVMALGWRDKRMDRATLITLTLTVFFGFMLFKSRRFVEYFPAFVLIFSALSIDPLLKEWQEKQPSMTKFLPVGMLILLLLPLKITLTEAREALSKSKPADRYAEASLWLRENTAPGTQVFQTDWDDFTRLFFYNDEAIYTAGLDPTYMELFDKDLYDEWVDITRGNVDQPSSKIRQRFGGEYIFSDLNHGKFINKAEDDPDMEELYRDEYAVIFKVTE